jgi:hypothetical protein
LKKIDVACALDMPVCAFFPFPTAYQSMNSASNGSVSNFRSTASHLMRHKCLPWDDLCQVFVHYLGTTSSNYIASSAVSVFKIADKGIISDISALLMGST